MIDYIQPILILLVVMIGSGLMSVAHYLDEKAKGKETARKFSVEKAKFYFIGGVLAFVYILIVNWSGINNAVESIDIGYLALAIPQMANHIARALRNFDERNDYLRNNTEMSREERYVNAGMHAYDEFDEEEFEEDMNEPDIHDGSELEQDKNAPPDEA